MRHVCPYQSVISVTILSVKNTDDKPFDFTSLLHTYFSVDNISSLEVRGLSGTNGFDQLTSSNVVAPDAIKFTQNVDSIYRQAENAIKIESDGGCVELERKNLPGKSIIALKSIINLKTVLYRYVITLLV